MGEINPAAWVRPLAGLLGSDQNILEQGLAALGKLFGPLAGATEAGPFKHTDYYAHEMGNGLWRQFVVFHALRPPEELADWKIAANQLEQELGLNAQGGRRVNIDPGYLAPGKLVLASTKDHEQRIYLRQGIYAEITLRVRDRRFRTWDWTYPDYAEASEFFDGAYQDYLRELARLKQPQPKKSVSGALG